MDSWPELTLRDLCAKGRCDIKTGPFGTMLKAAEYVSEGVPLISTREIGHGGFRISSSTPRVGEATLERLPQFRLREGDVVFARKGGVERNCYVSSTEDGWFLGSDALRIRVGEDVCGRFLAYHVASPFIRRWLVQQAGGSTMASLNQEILERIPVPLPPSDEQRRIAGVLEAFDDLIETNRRLADAIAALVASTYEVELAYTANRVHLSDVSRHLPGKYLPKKTYEAGGPYPVYGSNSVMGSYTSYLYAGPLTVMARIGSNCGALRLSESSAWINNNASAIKAIDPRMQVRLHEALRRVEMDNHRAGTGQPFIRTESLMGERIPWPTKPSPWDAASGDLVEAAAALEEESGDLIRQRDELLPLLISGKVRVSEVEGVA